VQRNISRSIRPDGLETGCLTIGDAAGRCDMVKNIEDMQKFGKDNMDATVKSLGALSKSLQAITIEIADYSKKVFEQSAAATEKLIGAKSLEKAIEVQSDYAKSAYETFVAEAMKLGELYADLAREAYKPFETQFGKVASVK
jgi:phasin family protein